MKPDLSVVATPQTPLELIQALEQCGGRLDTLCAMHCPSGTPERWLFECIQKLDKHPKLRQRWDRVIQLGKEVRFEYMQAKALTRLETFQNPSETSGAAEISWLKTVLSDFLTGRIERAKFPYKGTELATVEDKKKDDIDCLLEESA